jgi:hypothetical protein
VPVIDSIWPLEVVPHAMPKLADADAFGKLVIDVATRTNADQLMAGTGGRGEGQAGVRADRAAPNLPSRDVEGTAATAGSVERRLTGNLTAWAIY